MVFIIPIIKVSDGNKNQNKDTDNDGNSLQTFQLLSSDLVHLSEHWVSKILSLNKFLAAILNLEEIQSHNSYC